MTPTGAIRPSLAGRRSGRDQTSGFAAGAVHPSFGRRRSENVLRGTFVRGRQALWHSCAELAQSRDTSVASAACNRSSESRAPLWATLPGWWVRGGLLYCPERRVGVASRGWRKAGADAETRNGHPTAAGARHGRRNDRRPEASCTSLLGPARLGATGWEKLTRRPEASRPHTLQRHRQARYGSNRAKVRCPRRPAARSLSLRSPVTKPANQ